MLLADYYTDQVCSSASNMFPVLFLFLILKYPVFSLAETAKRKLFLGANCALFHHPSQRWWLLRVVDGLIQTCMRKSQVLCPYEEDQSVYFKCFKISQTDDFPNLGLILLPRGPHRSTCYPYIHHSSEECWSHGTGQKSNLLSSPSSICLPTTSACLPPQSFWDEG